MLIIITITPESSKHEPLHWLGIPVRIGLKLAHWDLTNTLVIHYTNNRLIITIAWIIMSSEWNTTADGHAN